MINDNRYSLKTPEREMPVYNNEKRVVSRPYDFITNRENDITLNKNKMVFMHRRVNSKKNMNEDSNLFFREFTTPENTPGNF